MSIEEHKTQEDPSNKLRKELESIQGGKFLTQLFKQAKLKKEVAELGLAFLKKKEHGYYYYEDFITLGSKEGPLGMAQLFKTPSISRRKS